MAGEDATDYSARVAEAVRERYEIERIAGRGGMSIVYLAHDRRLGRPVALKVLDPAACSRVGAERFLREVRITAPLQHPNILPLIDSGTVGDIVYSVMPFVEGESVRERLLREGPLPAEDALLYAREVAEALEYAHRRGIVHRDVKPENILLSGGQAVLTDFGIARASTLPAEQTLTGAGGPVGTPAYMSPEQIRGREPVDGRSDVYSLGCTLYEMLSGRPPFEGASVPETLSMHLEQEPPPIQRRRPELPARVAATVARAMAKRPADRFPSMGELAAELRAILGEPPRQPTPADGARGAVEDRLGGLERPSRAGGWLVLAALVLLVLAAAVSLRPSVRPRTATTSLAVLPFAAEPAGSVDAFLAEGVAREVGAALNGMQGLTVTAPPAAATLVGVGLSPQRIADTLGVEHVLAGSVSRVDGGRYRAVVRLLRAGGGAVLQRTYTFDEAGIARVAREIARHAGTELLGGATLPARPGHAPELVTTLVLRGRYWLGRPSPDGLREARTAFAAAVAADSSSAEAQAGLAQAEEQAVVYGYRGTDDLYSLLADAIRRGERAVRLAPADPDARFAGASAAHFRAMALGGHAPGDFDSVIVRYEDALALAPDSPEALADLAHLHAHLGHADSALALARAAVQRAPLTAGMRHSAITVALGVRRYDLAVEWARARLAQAPDDLVALALEGYALVLLGRAAECADREHGPWLAARALCLHAAGRAREAEVVADSLRAMLEREEYATVHQFTDLATYYAWTGRAADALRWLERQAAHSPFTSEWILSSGFYDRVVAVPAFAEGRRRLARQSADRLSARLAMLGS